MFFMDTKQLLSAILGAIVGFYIVVYSFVPQLATWAAAVSCVDGVDYGWTIYLSFLVIMIAIVYGIVKKAGIGGV